MEILAICLHDSWSGTFSCQVKSLQIHVCPGTTDGVFNIPPVALDPSALQRSLSPHYKDSSGLCHPHKAPFSSSTVVSTFLKLMSRLCHFSQWAGLVSSSLSALRSALRSAVSAPIASPSSVTPPSGVTVMNAASLSLRTRHPTQLQQKPASLICKLVLSRPPLSAAV